MNKGQIEMIGLVIVVILLAVGLLFYLKFSVFRENTSKEDVTMQNAYVTNLMISVFNMEICEGSTKIEEGIVACFNGENICENEACSYVNTSIKSIISDIGLKSYKNYSVWIEKGSLNKTIINQCRTGIQTHTTVVTPNRDHYTAFFRLC